MCRAACGCPRLMNFQKPYPPRMVVLIIACISASIQTSFAEQETSPIVTDRMDSGIQGDVETVPVAPLVRQDQVKHDGWELGTLISAAYDSNIFLSSSKPTSDMVFRIGPVIAYSTSDSTTGEGGFIKVAYHPTAVIYATNNSDNRIDHQALLTAGWRGKVIQLTYKGAIQKLGDATADTGRLTDRVEFENELRAAWRPREKVTLEWAIGNQQSDYSDPTLFSSNKIYTEIASRYAYSPKTQIGLAYQVAQFKVLGSPDHDTQQLTGAIDWQPREKIRILLKAGAEYRKVANDSQINPVLESRVEWTSREGTSVYITAYQRQETSAYYAGQIYNAKGVTAGISQRLSEKWATRLETGFEKATYSQVSGSGASGRSDRIWFVRPALEYKISDESNIAVFYRVSNDSSSDPAFGYAQHMAGIEFVYKF